jgi:hypothetical protein
MYTVVSLFEVCARKKRYRYIAQISSNKLMIHQVLGAAAPSCMPMTPIYHAHINFALTSKCILNKKWCCNYNYDTIATTKKLS